MIASFPGLHPMKLFVTCSMIRRTESNSIMGFVVFLHRVKKSCGVEPRNETMSMPSKASRFSFYLTLWYGIETEAGGLGPNKGTKSRLSSPF